jgi:FkbM family methyltransferase
MGCKLALHRRDYIINTALLLKNYEVYELNLFQEALSPGQTVVDFGANIGIYSCVAGKALHNTGRVFAFEPDPENFALLESSVALNRLTNVHAVAKAVSDSNGTLPLSKSTNNMGDHRLFHAAPDRPSVSVPIIRFDDYWREYHKGELPPIDVMKIDVQGAEARALAGMEETLRASPRLKVFLEFSPEMLVEAGSDPRAFLEKLFSLGFRISLILPESCSLRPVTTIEPLSQFESRDGYVDLFLERSA